MNTFNFFFVNTKRSRGRSIPHYGFYPVDKMSTSKALETKEKIGRSLITVHPGNFIFIFFISQRVREPTIWERKQPTRIPQNCCIYEIHVGNTLLNFISESKIL